MPARAPVQADKILEIAARLFGGRRFHEVRMEDIAAEAAVGKGSLYRYFRDKEELYLALLERWATQLTARVHAAVEPVEGSGARLRTIVEQIIAYFDEQPHLFALIQRAEVMRGVNTPWQHTRDEISKLLLGLFEEARTQGEFNVVDPELAALMLLGGLRSVIRFGTVPRPAHLGEQIVDGFLRGYARREIAAPTQHPATRRG